MLFHVHKVALNQWVQDSVCQGPAYLPLNRLWIALPCRLHVMLCEFISAPCVSKIQGFTMVGLIFRGPSCPWQHWKPRRWWGKLEGSWPRGFAESSACRCLRSYRCCRRINFGNYCSKGIWAAVRRRNAGSNGSVGLPLSGMIWGKPLYHRLAAFAGDWARWEVEENQGWADLTTSQLMYREVFTAACK